MSITKVRTEKEKIFIEQKMKLNFELCEMNFGLRELKFELREINLGCEVLDSQSHRMLTSEEIF